MKRTVLFLLLTALCAQELRAEEVTPQDLRGRMLMEILDVLQQDLQRLNRQKRELTRRKEKLEKTLAVKQESVSATGFEIESVQKQIGGLLRSLVHLKAPDDLLLLLNSETYQEQHLYQRTVRKIALGLARKLRQLLEKKALLDRQFVQESRELQLLYSEYDRLEMDIKELDTLVQSKRTELAERTERIAAVENLFMTPASSYFSEPVAPEPREKRGPKDSFRDHRNRRSLRIPLSPGMVVKQFEELPSPPRGTEKMVRGWILVSLSSKSQDIEVKAPMAGRVVFVGDIPGYGRLLILDHGDGYHTVYGNLFTTSLLTGDEVKEGATLATLGESSSAGVHPYLYFELRENRVAVDPKPYFMLRPVKPGERR